MERSRALLTVGILASACLTFGQGPSGRQASPASHPLLEAVMKASSSLRFAGIREVTFPQQGGQVSKFRERVLQDGVKKRIEYSAGGPFAGHIAVDDGKVWQQYNPETKEIRERPSMGEPWMMFVRGMGRPGDRRFAPGGSGRRQGRPPGENAPPAEGSGPGPSGRGGPRPPLQVERESSQKVAGLDSTVLAFKGFKDQVISRLWIEPNRKLILKSESYGPDGRVFAGFEFIAIKFDPAIPPQAFTLNIAGARRVTSQDEAERAFKILKLSPFGIKPDSGWRLTNVHKMDTENIKFVSLSYSNKDARVTLFVVEGQPDKERLRKMAGDRASVYAWNSKGVNLVLLGGLDEAGLRKLSTKVVPLKAGPRHP